MHDERVKALERQVRCDLLEHLRDLQKHGPCYIEEYVASMFRAPHGGPRPKARLHPKLAELVRDLALDAAAMDRRACGVAVTTESLPAQGTVVSRRRSPRKKAAA
jgi:hypothetical protein